MKVTRNTAGLDKLRRNMKKISGSNEVPLSDMLTDAFIQKHSTFQTLQELIDASGIQENDEIRSPEFSAFVAANTDFGSYDEMIRTAGAGWAKKQLFK